MMSMSLECLQEESPAQLVLDFMRSPFGGHWIGDVGYLSAEQIADGSGVSRKQVYSTMRRICIESKIISGTRVYRIKQRCMCGKFVGDSELVDIGDGLPRCPHCSCH